MAHTINDTCIACGVCEPECKEKAISAGDPIYTIDAGKCTDCGDCVAVCPVNCIEKKE